MQYKMNTHKIIIARCQSFNSTAYPKLLTKCYAWKCNKYDIISGVNYDHNIGNYIRLIFMFSTMFKHAQYYK